MTSKKVKNMTPDEIDTMIAELKKAKTESVKKEKEKRRKRWIKWLDVVIKELDKAKIDDEQEEELLANAEWIARCLVSTVSAKKEGDEITGADEEMTPSEFKTETEVPR